MISVSDYFKAYSGNPGITDEHLENAAELLSKVNQLLERAQQLGWEPKVNPATGTMVSGLMDGGWRPQSCPIGASNSAHKQGKAVDVADKDGSLDALISEYDKFDGVQNALLEEFGLFREAQDWTATWCHLTTRAPGSGRRSFKP